MTNWSELEELAPTELDEFDPSAPMQTRDHVDDVVADPSDDLLFLGRRPSLLGPDGEFDLNLGFSDASGLVRIWVDEHLNFTKCRVSPSWRDKLGGQDRVTAQAALVHSFGVAFMSINNSQRTREIAEAQVELDQGPLPKAKGPLTWEALAEFNIATRGIVERLDAMAPDEGHGTWHGAQTVGRGAGGRVQVTLSLEGRYSTVAFEKRWLDESRVSQISRAVIEAAHDARSNFQSPIYEEGERDILHQEHQTLRLQMRAMMQRGFN